MTFIFCSYNTHIFHKSCAESYISTWMDEGLLIHFYYYFNLTFFHPGHSLLHSQQHYVITATLNKQITYLPPIYHFTAQCSVTVWTSHPTTSVAQPVCHFPDLHHHSDWFIISLPLHSSLPVQYTHIFLFSYLSWTS